MPHQWREAAERPSVLVTSCQLPSLPVPSLSSSLKVSVNVNSLLVPVAVRVLRSFAVRRRESADRDGEWNENMSSSPDMDEKDIASV